LLVHPAVWASKNPQELYKFEINLSYTLEFVKQQYSVSLPRRFWTILLILSTFAWFWIRIRPSEASQGIVFASTSVEFFPQDGPFKVLNRHSMIAE
jgi:hypothetical protein